MLRNILPLVLLFTMHLPSRVEAQSFQLSEAFSTRNQLGYEIIGKYQDSYLLFRDKRDEFDIMAFNSGMVNVWTRDIEIPTKSTRILSVLGGENDFSIFYKTRIKGDYVVGIRKFDPGAGLIDSLTLKTYGGDYYEQPVITTVVSENKQFIAFIDSQSDDKLQMLCFAVDKMQILWEKSFFLDKDLSDRKIPNFILSNEGTLLLVTDENNKRSKIAEHRIRVVTMNKATDNLFSIPLDQNITSDVLFRIDKKNNKLVGAGLYAEKNLDRVIGHFFVQFDLSSQQHTVKYHPFSEQIAGVLAGKDEADPMKGVAHLEIKQMMIRNDGGALLICERNHFIERGLTSARGGFWRDAPRRVVDYFYDDLLLINTQPNGDVQWRTVLHKKQYSQDDEAIYSSFFLMQSAEKLRIFFNDEIQNDNTCSAYVVTPAGTYNRESILNTEDLRIRLRYRDAEQLNGREFIVPSEVTGKLQLLLVAY